MNLSRRRNSLLVVATVVVLAASACQWPSMRGGPTNAAFASDETTLSLADAGFVDQFLKADLGFVADGWQTPTVSGSQIFAPSADGLAVFDLNGINGCTGGAPKRCEPVWSGDVGDGTITTAATATGTTVFVTAESNGANATLYAFDVRGETGCSGSPRRCQPLWTAPDMNVSPPVVVGTTVYVATTDGRTPAFDAGGTTGCSGTPKVCSSLWQTAGEDGAASSPAAVAGGMLFHTSFEGELWAYDAAGVDGCSGTPKVCRRLWIGETGGRPTAWPTAPVVSGDRVYVSMDELDEWNPSGRTTLTGFELDGGPTCATGPSSTPVCQPTWTGVVDGRTQSNEMAAAYGSLYVETVVGSWPSFASNLAALDLDDPACSPGPCDAAWTAELGSGGGLASPIVANGVVYADAIGSVQALDAHGVIGCSGSPKVCTPALFSSLVDPKSTGWAISNGKLHAITYDAAGQQTLRVFG